MLWVYKIQGFFEQVEFEGVDWIQLAADSFQWRDDVNTVMNLPSPKQTRNFLVHWAPINFWKALLCEFFL